LNFRGGDQRAVDKERLKSTYLFIEALVCAVFGVSRKDLRLRRRGRAEVAFARQTAMYLAHVSLGLTLSDVGDMFGRDRTTVAHACARIEDSRDRERLERLFDCLEAAVCNWPAAFLSGDGA
jgi:chromosomal replication initiation ATPase DnaA